MVYTKLIVYLPSSYRRRNVYNEVPTYWIIPQWTTMYCGYLFVTLNVIIIYDIVIYTMYIHKIRLSKNTLDVK